MTRSVALRTTAALAATALLAGCTTSAPSGGAEAPDTRPTLPVGDPVDVAPRTPVFAVGRTVHVGERTFRARSRLHGFWVGRRGVYYRSGRALVFTDGTRSETVGRVRSGVALRSDRAVLGWIDVGASPAEPAVAVAFDLETGRQLVRTTVGNGGPDDDLSDAYEDGPPTVVGFDDEALVYQGICCRYWRAPLDGSPVERLPDTDDARSDHRSLGEGEPTEDLADDDLRAWTDRLVPLGTVGPGRRWAVLDGGREAGPPRELFRPVDARTGRPVEVDLPPGVEWFRLGPWRDEDEVWAGVARPRGDAWAASVVLCDLPRRVCREVTERFAVADPARLRLEGD